ncbi:MAG: toll/interleukin-1 receptor domain-containing protein [Caldimonas sp.]
MTARVFISYRSSDGADKATALARDLDALFGDDQIFLDKEDLAPGSRWRDEIARALGNSPILIVLVTPNYLGARDAEGRRCIDREDDPARDELQAGVAAKAHIIPLLCDGVATMPAPTELPSPFDQLCELQWGRLRAYDWRADLGRLADDLRQLGLTPRPASMPGTIPVPLLHEPITTPMPLDGPGGESTAHAGPAEGGRRGFLGLAAFALLAFGGWEFMRWREQRAANLSGPWRARIGARGAPSSRDGEQLLVTLEQKGNQLRLASNAVDIEHNPEWENYRDFWKERTGAELNRVFYRGEGKIVGDDEDESLAAEPGATEASAAAEASGPARSRKGEAEPGRHPAQPVAVRRIVLSIHIATPGSNGETIDQGAFRGVVDAEDQRIHGRLWLNSEQAERVVDLRRGGG